MRTRRRHVAALAGIIALGTLLPGAAIAQPTSGPSGAPVTFALIGDTPYGPEQRSGSRT